MYNQENNQQSILDAILGDEAGIPMKLEWDLQSTAITAAIFAVAIAIGVYVGSKMSQ